MAAASIHGNTLAAAREMAEMLKRQGEEHVEVVDLARTDVSWAVRKAFFYDRLVLAAATYDGGVFPCMEVFLQHLKSKNYQKRKVALVENGTWAPLAAKAMKGMLESMKQITVVEPAVTIRSVLDDEGRRAMAQAVSRLAD